MTTGRSVETKEFLNKNERTSYRTNERTKIDEEFLNIERNNERTNEHRSELYLTYERAYALTSYAVTCVALTRPAVAAKVPR